MISPTVIFERLLGKGAFFSYLPTLGDAFMASRGDNPLVVGGKIIGAIGASNGTGVAGRHDLVGRCSCAQVAFATLD